MALWFCPLTGSRQQSIKEILLTGSEHIPPQQSMEDIKDCWCFDALLIDTVVEPSCNES